MNRMTIYLSVCRFQAHAFVISAFLKKLISQAQQINSTYKIWSLNFLSEMQDKTESQIARWITEESFQQTFINWTISNHPQSLPNHHDDLYDNERGKVCVQSSSAAAAVVAAVSSVNRCWMDETDNWSCPVIAEVMPIVTVGRLKVNHGKTNGKAKHM